MILMYNVTKYEWDIQRLAGVNGIEPLTEGLKSPVLPLNYTPKTYKFL